MDPLSLIVILLYGAALAKASSDPVATSSTATPPEPSSKSETVGTEDMASVIHEATSKTNADNSATS